MNKMNKYLTLAVLLLGGLLALIGSVVIIYYILKLISVAFFNIPGSSGVFHVFILLVPYIIYFSAYYYLRTKIAAAQTRAARVIARILLIAGILTCITCLILTLLVFAKIKNEWLSLFDDYSQYVMIIQILLLFTIAVVLATGDAKEKNWMKRNNNS